MKNPLLYILIGVCAGSLIGVNIQLSAMRSAGQPTVQATQNPKWDGERYVGWDMPCNYTLGSNAEWNEKLQQYGDQKYLDCGNGIVYVAVGDSPSTHYFNPKDDKTNAKYCDISKSQVANFNYDNPLTAVNEEGTFYDCSTW